MKRVPGLLLFLFVFVFAAPAIATECVNSGAAPSVAPNDTDDGGATACGDTAFAAGNDASAYGLDLAATHMSHLRKIEELMLYTLRQQELIDEHVTVNRELVQGRAELERRMVSLERRLAELEGENDTPLAP